MEERQPLILDRLEKQGACSFDELSKLLGVSTMTIRRDVDGMARRGAVIRIVGGVQKADAPSYLYETAVHSRLAVQRESKRAIARKALELVVSQHTIFLDGSTTCLELAKLLANERKGLTIVTNSALACLELGKNTENVIIGIGGQFDANSLSYVGPQAEDWAKTLFVDLAFVSTKGFLPSKGTYESFMPTFRIKQIIAQQCVELALLVDHSKFGQRALSKVLDISQIHAVITDDQAPPAAVAALKAGGRKVHIATVGEHTRPACENRRPACHPQVVADFSEGKLSGGTPAKTTLGRVVLPNPEP
ncbi:MAG: DeoR/GlpR transcriptional regulator [Verrucomicrobia bacterium]|nr:DeoR/GlpR transcriptional regulator [Verrucomicrobiota bacterium]